MKVTVEQLPRREVLLNIEAEAPEYEHARQAAGRRLSQRARIPGFRPGKAPLSMVEQYLGKSALLEETVNHLVPEVTNQAIKEQAIEAAGQPNIELGTVEPTVTWKATVPLTPLVDLKDYKALRMEAPTVEIPEADVDKVLEDLRFQQAPWQPAGRAAAAGDLLTLDVTGVEGGKTVVSQTGVEYRAVAGSPYPVLGFAEALIGLESGAHKEFDLVVPDTDERPDFLGKTFSFTVDVKEVKHKQVAALDDEFAKGIGEGGYDNLAALRDYLRGQLLEGAKQRANDELREKAIQKLTEESTVEFSPHLVEHEVEHMVEDEARRQNSTSLEQYLSTIGKTQAEVLSEMRPRAEERIRRSLILTELKDKENIVVLPEEIEAELNGLITSAGAQAPQMERIFNSETGIKSIERTLLTRKTLDRLVQIFTGAADAAPSTSA